MGAQDYMVGNAPGGVSYAAPLVGFDIGKQLASLPNSYFQGTQQARTLAEQNAFKNGLPRTPDGQLDINAMTETAAKVGGLQYAQPLIQMMMNQQIGQGAQAAITGNSPDAIGAPGSFGAGASSPNATTPQTRGNASANPSAAGPANITLASPRGGGYAGGDNGSNTIMSIVSGQVGAERAGPVALQVAQRMGVDPNQPLTEQQVPMVGRALMAAGGGQPMYGSPQVTPGQNQPMPGLNGGYNEMTGQRSPQPPSADTSQPVGTTSAADAQINGPAATNSGSQFLPPGYTMQAVQQLETAATRARGLAARYGALGNQQVAQSLENQANDYSNRAKMMREAIQNATKPSGEEIEANRLGMTTPQLAATKANATKTAEDYVKEYGDIRTKGREADSERPQLSLIKRLIDDPQFYSGMGEPFVQKLRQATVALNGDPNAGTPMEAFGKAVANLALSQVKAMAGTGPVRVAEMNIIQQANASGHYTPATNRLLVEIADRNYLRNQDLFALARTYNGGRLDTGFDGLMDRYDKGQLTAQQMQGAGLQRQGSLFTQDELADWRRIAPPVVRTPADLKRFGWRDGMPFKTPDGRIFTHAPQGMQ